MALTSCADTHEGGMHGGETSWLAACESDATCTGAARCVCGVCSDDCRRDGECAERAVCRARDSALVIEARGAMSAHGLCAPPAAELDAQVRDATLPEEDAAEPSAAVDASNDAASARDAATSDAETDAEVLEQTIVAR